MVVKGIDRGVKVVVEKLDCFDVEDEERAGGKDKGKMGGINGEVISGWGDYWLLFSMMMANAPNAGEEMRFWSRYLVGGEEA